MAMDNRLIAANDALSTAAFDFGFDSPEYEAATQNYIEVFKTVAAERGESVIGWENPYDHIIEAIHYDPNPEWIEKALVEFKRLVDALESINYVNLKQWKFNYDECVNALKEVNQHDPLC